MVGGYGCSSRLPANKLSQRTRSKSHYPPSGVTNGGNGTLITGGGRWITAATNAKRPATSFLRRGRVATATKEYNGGASVRWPANENAENAGDRDELEANNANDGDEPVINTAQKLEEMMLRTTMAALFHPTTKLYSLPLKAFVSHSLHKPQRLINRQSYPRADRTILSINTPRSLSSTAVPKISNDTTSDLDSSYLSCSMTNSKRPLKITVLLIGRVDSSVAFRLLHAVGHSCTAFYLTMHIRIKLFRFMPTMSGFEYKLNFVGYLKIQIEDFQNFWCECPWEEDLKYAKAVCNQIAFFTFILSISFYLQISVSA
ncbi:unnamed protein product [Lactuca virosa]|uniref:Uncharacterized protein n=1 Tax=Lactuca virosa TaxID=75947 RepID=A0AAU9PY26_9ASTR|nr:unnamed protein product [Lactuca virosa]